MSIFDNTKNVKFDEKIYDKILECISQEGESFPLTDPVMAQGNVENWLGELLHGSHKSLHKIIRDASVQIQDPSFNLMEFENSYVAQVGLLGIQLIWTKESEDALNLSKSDKKVMQNANQRFLDLLNMLIAVTTTNLTKIERVKFETLICIHVHQKDIFDELVVYNYHN